MQNGAKINYLQLFLNMFLCQEYHYFLIPSNVAINTCYCETDSVLTTTEHKMSLPSHTLFNHGDTAFPSTHGGVLYICDKKYLTTEEIVMYKQEMHNW